MGETRRGMACKENTSPVSLALHTLCFFASTLTNSCLIYTISKSGLQRSRLYFLILNISITDLIFGLVINGFGMVSAFQLRNDVLQDIYTCLLFFLGGNSILQLAAVHCDRFLLIKYQGKYRLKIQMSIIFPVSCWILTCMFGLFSIFLKFSLSVLLFSIIFVLTTTAVVLNTLLAFWCLLKVPAQNYPTRIQSPVMPGISIQRLRQIKPTECNEHLSNNLPGIPEFNYVSTTKQQRNSVTPNLISIEDCKHHKIRFGIGFYERKILLTLLIIALVFVLSYTVISAMAFCLYFCSSCSCTARQHMKEVIVIIMCLNAAVRPVVFLNRLNAMRECFYELAKKKFKEKKYSLYAITKW